MSDALIDEIAIIGSEDEIRERISQDAEGGIHTHIIAPLQGASQEDVARTFAAFTPDRFQLP